MWQWYVSQPVCPVSVFCQAGDILNQYCSCLEPEFVGNLFFCTVNLLLLGFPTKWQSIIDSLTLPYKNDYRTKNHLQTFTQADASESVRHNLNLSSKTQALSLFCRCFLMLGEHLPQYHYIKSNQSNREKLSKNSDSLETQ